MISRVLTSVCLAASVAFAFAATSHAAVGDKENPDWPCVQRKVLTLTSTQIWDGPPVEDVRDWSSDAEILKLVPGLVSRRVPMDEAVAAIKSFSGKLPASERDAKLTRLFAGVLTKINEERASVISGVERFQKRLRGRAGEIERQSSEIVKLEGEAKDDETRKALAAAQEKHAWEVRIFQERQQNIPLACEIPVTIEARAFELGREIRGLMSK